MSNKMTTNSQLSTAEHKTKQEQKQTKKTTGTGTESQKCRSHGELSAGKGGLNRGKVQGIRSINGRQKIDRGD